LGNSRTANQREPCPTVELKETELAPNNDSDPPEGGNGDRMSLRFWGVRGSLPTPGPSTVRYGGDTLCVELRCGPYLLMLNGGSGAREFGKRLAAMCGPVDSDILLSHSHLDHICGLPFFAPMYDPKARLRFWGGHLAPPDGIAQALLRSWRAPLMPDVDSAFHANLAFQDFTPGDVLTLHPGLRVMSVALNSVGGIQPGVRRLTSRTRRRLVSWCCSITIRVTTTPPWM
jgi:phosphoribosyl 1,2-cyclic phosphodiesterase